MDDDLWPFPLFICYYGFYLWLHKCVGQVRTNVFNHQTCNSQMCIYFIDTIIDCFRFIHATIINCSRFVYLFFQFVKIIKWWHVPLLHIRWTKSHEILWFLKRIFDNLCAPSLYLKMCVFVYGAAVWCSVLSIACRFYDELFQKVKHIYYPVSLCVSFCPPLL